MNKKGSLLQYVFFLILFIGVWAVWLGGFLVEYGQKAVTNGGYTGLEAMFWLNLNLVVFIFLLGGTYVYFYFGGGE